jgi:hypothetical protein
VASRRRALVVATYEYADGGLRRLAAPEHDAESFAEVLKDEAIAGFDVTMLVNQPHHVVGEAIADFYGAAGRDDLTLLYFTGHGLKDDEGRLYLAMTNTRREALMFTAISGAQLNDAMDASRSRRKVLILDCCYSGAFPAGRTTKSDEGVQTLERFQGKGRAVLTASDATQYAFEGDDLRGSGTSSVFTRYLVEAISSGAADLDEDGDIALDELYSYVYDRVVAEVPQQRPKKQEDVDGRILIARNVHWKLPAHLQHAIESPIAAQRLSAVEGLAHLHRVGNQVVRATVEGHVVALAEDDSRSVSAAATAVLADLAGLAAHAAPPVEWPRARGDVPAQRAWRDKARLDGASPLGPVPPRPAAPVPSLARPEADGSPPAHHVRSFASGAPRHPIAVTAASSEDVDDTAQRRPTRRLRLSVALLAAAVLLLVTARALVFESTNGYHLSDFGFGLDLLVAYLLPLCGGIVLLLLVLRGAASVPPDWLVPAATGLAAGVFLCVAVEVLRTTLLLGTTSGYGPGPGYWALLAAFVVLAAACGLLLGRGGLAGRPAFAWDTGTIAAPLILAALAIAITQVVDYMSKLAPFLTIHGPMALLAATGLLLAVLRLDREQSLASLVAITLFGGWLACFLLVVPQQVVPQDLVSDHAVVTVECLVAIVLAAHGAQFLRRRGSVRHGAVPTEDRR